MSRGLRPRLVAASVTAAIATLALVAGVASAHTVGFSSEVTIAFQDRQPRPDGSEGDNFNGTVTSPKPACVRNRTVQVFRVVGPEPDQVVFVGSDVTDANGRWILPFEDAPQGDYYARASGRVLRNTAEHLHRCLRDTSPTVHVGPHS
jgi:hypothetical protein